MTYDLTGGWDTQTGYNSPLYDNSRPGVDHAIAEVSVSSAMAYWNRTRGVPKSKLLYGQPFFGFVFSKVAAPGAAFTENADYVAYSDIAALLPTWKIHRDDTAEADWATTPEGAFATWDQPASVGLKARWARANGYAGAIVWDLSQDALPNAGHPLLDSLAANLRPDGTATRPRSLGTAGGFSREGRYLVARWPTAGQARLEVVGLDGRRWAERRGVGGVLRMDLAGLPPGPVVARLQWPGETRQILVGVR
jgi:chitinase